MIIGFSTLFFFFFFFNDTATTEIYTLSLHDALPIFLRVRLPQVARRRVRPARLPVGVAQALSPRRILLRPLQQPADGVLLARRPGTRRRAERGRDPAPRRERERRVVHD